MFFIALTSKVIKTEVRVSLLVFLLDPSSVKLMPLCVGWAVSLIVPSSELPLLLQCERFGI